MDDNKKKLYNALSEDYDMGSFEQFSTDIQDSAKRQKLYDAIKGEYDLPNFAEFSKQLGIAPQPAQATRSVQQQTVVQKPAAVQKPAPNPQPLQVPEGFGELDIQQANRMGMGLGPVSWNQPTGQTMINPSTGKPEQKEERNIAKDLTKAVRGDKEAAKRSGLDTAVKRMQEEREYVEATGKPLRNIVNTPVTAPTAVKGEDGQMLMGQTTDEQRVAQYQQQEREIERKKIVQPIVDDIQKKLESEVPATTVPGAVTSGAQYQAMMNQTGILQRMNQADSPEKLWKELEGYFGFGGDTIATDGTGSRVLAHWDDKKEDGFEQFLVDHQSEIAQSASRLGMTVEDFTWNDLIPQLSNDVAERFNQNMSEKYSVKNTGDYLAKRMINSSIGALARMSAGVTAQQSQLMQQELQKSNEGEGAHFNARWYAKAIGEVAQFAPDAPLMMIGGVIGGAATKTVGAGLRYLGAESLGALVAQGSPLLAANVGKAVKYGGILGNRIIGSAANMGSFMGMSGMLQAMASTDSTEQGYWSSIGLAGLEGLGEGIKMGTALGVLGVAGGKLSGLASTAKGRAAIATGAFLAENQIFALSDYLADPDKFNWVDSSLDAFYMMMAGRVSGLATHGTEGMKQSFQHILYGEPMKDMPRLTEDEKAMIQRAFGGMDFVDIAGDVQNIGKILADKENIPLNVRQKISGATMGAFEPNRPHTYMTNIRGNEIQERAKDGELLAVHKFADVDERDRIMQEIADRKANDEMISYYNILNLRNQEGLTDELNRFCDEYQITLPEVQDIMAKKPIERVEDEQMLMDELSKRLHDAAFPEGELHPAQSEVDGNNLAGRGPVADPNIAAQIAQEADKAKAEYDQFMQTNTDMQEGIAALGEARPDEVLMYIANNFSGTTRDEGMRIVSNYYNTQAKKNGYIQTIGDNINNYVDQEIESNGFKGTLDGAPDEANIITVTDGQIDPNTGQPRRLTLLNGEVGTTINVETLEDGTLVGGGRTLDPDKSGGQIICRDENGQFVVLKPDARVSIVEQMPKEDYGNNLREELGVSNTTTLVETGVVKPEEPEAPGAAAIQQPTEQAAEQEPQPVGVGAFGNIYDQFRGKAKEAVAFLMKKRSGEATGALSHRSVGEIDLVWGEEGTGHSDGFGLAKLVKYHPEVVEHLQELLDEMEVVSRTANRVQLESATHKAGVRLDWDGERKTWLMTMFEKKGKSEPTTETTDTNGNLDGLGSDTALPQSPDVSGGKGTENIGTSQGISVKVDENGVKLYEQGTPVDDAIADIQADGFDVNETADLAISEAKEALDKIKKPKTRAEQVKNAGKKLELQNTIDYYTGLKERYKEQLAAEKALKEAQKAAERAEKGVTSQPKGKTVEEQKQERIASLKAELGEFFDDDFTKANDVNELVSMWLSRDRKLSRDSVGQELGWDMGVGKDARYIETMLAKKGEGMSINDFVHAVWESPENDVMDEKRYTTEEIREALLGLFQGAKSKSDVVDYAVNTREAQARKALEEQRLREEEAALIAQRTEPLTDEELAQVAAGRPFEDSTEDDFPDLPKSKQEQLVEEVSKILDPDYPIRATVIDAEHTSDKDWYDIASVANGGAFVGEEEISDIKRHMQDKEGGYFFDPDTGMIYTADHVSIDRIKELYNHLKEAYDRAKEEAETADDIRRELEPRTDGAGVEEAKDREGEPSGEDRPGEGGSESDGKLTERDVKTEADEKAFKKGYDRQNKEIELDGGRLESEDFYKDLSDEGLQRSIEKTREYLSEDWHDLPKDDQFDAGREGESRARFEASLRELLQEQERRNQEKKSVDEYLQPRNDKEKEIIAEVEKSLDAEIKAAEEDVRKAKSALEKAKVKESDRATDMFANDETFAEPDAIFSQEEMELDTSADGVSKRTKTEADALADAQQRLDRLQSPEERNSRVRGALDNERRQTGFGEDAAMASQPTEEGTEAQPTADPMAAIEQAAGDFRKEQDAAIGITREETPEQQADKEREEALNETPLTTEEIDGAGISDVQKTLAKAYLNGNHGILQEAAYLNAINDVRNRRQDSEADRTDAERGAQLDSGENQPEPRPGRTGEPAEPVDETQGGGTDEGQLRVEDGERQPRTPVGERGDNGVPESESAVDGLSAGGERPARGGEPGRERSDVRGGQSDSGGRKDTGKPVAGSDAAIAASKQRLAELRKKFRDAGKRDLSISLVGMNNEQIGILGEITTEAANLGYQYLAKGVREFKEWSRQMLDDFHDWLQEDMKWSDSEIDEYLNEVWNCEYNIDGVTRSIREWASFLGEENLRKQIKPVLTDKFEAQKAAESVEVKTGDIDNIRETLPFLLPEQQDDVLKAETQFFDESHQDREHGNGKGMMFTNGTGTGKTYTGLGIAKRFVKQGKGRVLILTPSQEKVTDWRNDGLNLGLNLESLDEDAKNQGTSATKAKGKGVVVTTYANARQNLKLLEDCFDLIIYDESHKITEGKEAAEGEMFKFHQMLTNKDVEKSIDRQTYWLPEWVEQRNLFKEREENQKKLDTLSKIDELTQAQEVLQQRLNARMPEIEKRLEELRPIMQEIRESKREQAEIDSKRTKTVFLSATPFNTRENLKYAEGYLFSYPEEDRNTIGSYNHRSPEAAFLERYFPAGYRWRYGRLESHVENAEALGRQEIDFSDYLQNQLGTLSGRMISSEYDYSRDFPVLTLDHAGRFNEAMSQVYRNKRYQPLAEAFRKSFDYNYSTALFEAMKTSLVIDRIKEHLNRGQKIVVFHRRRTSGDLEPPFERALTAARELAALEQDGKKKAEINNAIQAFREDFADMLEWEKTLDYTLPRDQIAKVFGDDKIGFFSGAENKRTKHQSVEDFIKDNGGKDIIVIQEASGKEGISLHDKTGEHQRVEINLALPQSPIAFIQIEGRIYRIGQKSNAIFEYPLLGLDLETSLFAQKFNSALGTTENLALGSKARNLRKSIANSILMNTGEVDYDRQGLGGKDMDGQVSGRDKDDFDVAISDYYGNQKLSGKRDNREGFDYFPTPEPVGFKMVEWAQLMEGESALEPSAGHGAIARYVPETNPLTAVEPSADLFSKLQMRAGGPGRRFEEKSFEDYPLANKHDAIVMNPPYGVQGKMAMEHVAKAFKHMNEGGRLIAIIPDGPAMEKRLDAWINSRGNASVYGTSDGVNGTAVMTGEVRLPDVAFSRAGTSVRTRIIIIDKVTRLKMREGMPDKVTVDLSGAKTVDELFDRLRNVSMPERTIDQTAIAQKQALKTKKAFEDNKFVRNVWIDEDGMRVDNRSSYGSVPDVMINFDRIDDPAQRERLLILYDSLNEARDNIETLDYGKWKNKTYGTGKNAVPATDVIRDYCDTAIKTIANVLKTTPDGLEKEAKARREEVERKRQEREAEMQRIISERDREKEERIKGIVETALAENPNNSVLSEGGIEANIKIAHGNIYLMAERAKRNLREAGIDWQTGKRIERKEAETPGAAAIQQPTRQEKKEPFSYKLDKNTNTGADMHLVVMNERVDDNRYNELKRKALSLNGYYNRFKKAWHFKTEEDARKFVEQLATESVKNVIDGINGGTTRFSEDGNPIRKKTPKTLFSEDTNENEEKLKNRHKDKSSEILFLSLPQKEGEDYYDTVNELADRLENGSASLYGEGETAWRGKTSRIQKAAEIIAADTRAEEGSAGQGTPDLSGSKEAERRIEEWAKSNNAWLSEEQIKREAKDNEEYDRGGENIVYESSDGTHVTKLLDPYARNKGGLLHAIQNISAFNFMFPESAYDVIGFTRDSDGNFRIVMTQPFAEGEILSDKEYEERGMPDKMRELFGGMGFSDVQNDALEFENPYLLVRDLHNGNFAIGSNGRIHVFDANVYLKPNFRKQSLKNEPVIADKTRFSEGEDEAAALPQHTRRIVGAIEKTAKKLNTPVKIAYSIDEVTNKDALQALREGRRIKGWFEEGTGEIVLYLPSIADRYSGERTVAHEVVGHHGLRALLGEEGYRSYMRTLALDLRDEKLSEYMRENMARHGFDIYTTVDEYLAEAAENGYGNLPMWQKVRDVMTNALRKAGFEMTPSISDVKYMVWLSKNQLENGDPTKAINREALLYRLGQEKYEAKVENGEFGFGGDAIATNTKEKVGFFPGNKTLFSSTPSAKTAKEQYERALSRLGYAWKESHIDQMQAGVELMRAIAGVKKIEDIPSVENFVLAENQMSSKEEQMDYLFNRDYMEPLDKAVAAVLPEFGSKTDDALRELQIYMIKKSGLERNRCLYVRDKIREYRKDADMDQNAVQQLEDDWNQLLDDIRNDIRQGDIDLREYLENMDAFIRAEIDPKYKADEHDYSGLTAVLPQSTGQKGYDDDAIIDEVMSTESMVGDERIGDLWEKTKAVSQYGLDMEYEGGLDSKEKHDRVSRMFEWYVPMRGYDETTAEEVYDYLEENKGGKWVGPVLMNAKGRESQSDVDIFAQLGAMSSHAINRALRNRMKQTFARFVRNHYDKDGDDRLVAELKYLWGEKRYDPTTGNEYWEEVFPDIPENATADEVAQIVEDFENDMKAKEGAGDAKRMRQNSSIPFRPSAKNKAKHIVEVYINGEKKTFIVNGNPRAAMAINGELKAETNHRMISKITRTMAQLNTSYNPDFIVGNTERDYIFSSAAILAKESPRYFEQWQANYFGRGIGRGAVGVPAMHTNLFKRYRANSLDMSNATDRYFKEFMENGGETGWVEQKNLDKWKKEVRDGVKAEGNIEKKAKWLVKDMIPDAIEAMNERAENAARFSTYMTSRQMGRSVMRSVSDAKEISVNFNRKGSGLKTKDLQKNGNSLQRMNAIVAARTAQFGQDYIMFYNAGVQGLNNASKILRDHPVKASTVFAGFALGALVMNQLNQSLIDDEDPQERGGILNPYAELPEWIRRNRLCLYIGKGEFATVDLPIELRALYGIGDIAAAYTTNPELRSDKPVWQDVLTQMTQILPVDFMGEHPGEPWMSFVPSFAMPFAEVAMNQNWYGRKIEKDQYVNEDDPRWTRAYKNANKAYIGASKSLNAATNQYSEDDLRKMGVKEEDLAEVDARIKGSADGKLTDPALVEHIVNGYFGGAGQTAGRLADVIKSLGSGENLGDVVKSPQIPIARRLHYSPTEQNKMARTRSKWWHYKDEMDEVNNEVKNFKEYGVVDPIAKMKQISTEDSVRATRAELMKDAQKQYRRLKRRYDKMEDGAEKEALQMRMDQLMENTVRGLDAIR